MATCPYCSDRLLRHISGPRVYWFCRTCWQEMPIIDLSDRPLAGLIQTIDTSHKTASLPARV